MSQLEFLVGSAVLLLPRGNLALLAGATAAKGAGALVRRVRSKRAGGGGSGSESELEPTPSLPRSLAPAADGAAAAGARPKTPVYDASVVPPVTLEWSDLGYEITVKGGGKKTVLRGVRGSAKPGRLLAIMGPSGSGKTSLLNMLAGQVAASSKVKLSGRIMVNGVDATAANHRQAYVEQNDQFYSMLTVNETLGTAAALQLPAYITAESRDAYVGQLISLLGLSKVAESRVGNEKVRGLSGGEKKRLAIGCELISAPSVMFLDEPTTGLDAFMSEQVMTTLQQLASGGHTVVASIHQPRSSIFALFDDLLLVAEGRVAYQGPAGEALAHFGALGHPCPEHYNPADFLADLIAIDFTSPETEAASRARVDAIVEAWAASSAAAAPAHMPRTASAAGSLVPAPRARGRLLRQFGLLVRRSWRQVTRDKATAVARLMSNLSSALIFGAIYFRMGRSQSSIQDRLGLLQVSAINTAMSSLIKTLGVFPTERVLVQRERRRASYPLVPYLGAKLLAELPVGAFFPLVFGSVVYPLCGLNPSPARYAKFLGILTLESFSASALGLAVGAVAPSAESAVAIGPAVILVHIVFGGLYVNADSVPRALRWLPRISLIKAAFQALVINEMEGLAFDADDKGKGMRTGADVLHWTGFDKTTVRASVKTQARILLAHYWLALNLLRANKARYAQLEAAAAAEVAAAAAEAEAEEEAEAGAGAEAGAAEGEGVVEEGAVEEEKAAAEATEAEVAGNAPQLAAA
ncbi:ATP-binding cassette transporter [Raphidocelis subcapitata]|uniref:ATP-binding cassette transporter n=1 Tax=Raphidocelis subcapitata TaxID=307507 RepID=A0A2V0NZB0_9CHLO|nr:ATP-binding cassette transporter [Raphidocelis subcapitata]|eukprot:GBF92012.1 ATP-binding cassette transporter [Raphidocelis subcapitata]